MCIQGALFSVHYVSSTYGQPVATCGTLLNPEAPASYKIIYSALAAAFVPGISSTAGTLQRASSAAIRFSRVPARVRRDAS